VLRKGKRYPGLGADLPRQERRCVAAMLILVGERTKCARVASPALRSKLPFPSVASRMADDLEFKEPAGGVRVLRKKLDLLPETC
jgi:hypothetical protein